MNQTVKLFVEAKFRIVGTIKGQELMWPEVIMLSVDIDNFPADPEVEYVSKVGFAMLDAAVRSELVKLFIIRLKTDTATKRKIGGTKWSVDLIGSIEEMPLYTEPADIGDYKKFVKAKEPNRRAQEIAHRNMAILHKIGRDMYFDEITRQGREALKAINDDMVKRVA